MRTHLKLKNFHVNTIDAATELFEARPWREENVGNRAEIAQHFAERVCAAYHVPNVTVQIGQGGYWRETSYTPAIVQMNAMEQIESMTPPTIVLAGWSIVGLFVAVRTHLLANGVEQVSGDPKSWAHSLFYTVKPAMFRKRVREGRIAGLTAKDTFTTETWGQLVSAGVGDEDGTLLVDPGQISEILEQIREGTYVAETDEEDEDESESFEDVDDNLPDEDESDEPSPAEEAAAVADEVMAAYERFSIVKLRQASRGRVSGGYSLSKPELIAALAGAGVTPEMVESAS